MLKSTISEEKKFNKIKYQTKLPKGPLNIIYAVSKDNKGQTGDRFSLFIDWAIENNKQIVNLEIILSDYLNRFYVGEQKAKEWAEAWKEENTFQLNRLEQAGISHQLIEWKSLLELEKYSQMKKTVEELYSTDQEFSTTVNGLAKSHQNKAGYDAAITYLLEESAVIATLQKGSILTYPASCLNGAIHFVLNKLQCGPHYIGHMFIHSKSKQDSSHTLHAAGFKFMCALQQTGYRDHNMKHHFFFQCLQSFSKNMNDFSSFSNTLTLQEHATQQSFSSRKDQAGLEELSLFSTQRRHSL